MLRPHSRQAKENLASNHAQKRPCSAVFQNSKPHPLANKSSVLRDKTGHLNTQHTASGEYKPVYTMAYSTYLQANKKYNYKSKSFNTLNKKSDPVTRFQQMNKEWNKSKFLKSNPGLKNGKKEGRKLNLVDRMDEHKQQLIDEGMFHRYVKKSQLFL